MDVARENLLLRKDNAEYNSFSSLLLYDWGLAVQRVDRGRRYNEQFMDMLRERANIEMIYGDSLLKLAKKFPLPQFESEEISEAALAVKREIIRRSDQAKELAESIDVDIVRETLNSTITNHYNVLKQICADGTNVHENFESSVNSVRKVEKDLEVAGRELLWSLIEEKKNTPGLSGMVFKSCIKTLTKLQEVEVLKARYVKQVIRANQVKKCYEEKIKIILDSLEDMDIKRLTCYKDSLRKLMVFQMSALKNLQYDSDIVIKAVDRISETDAVKDFLEKYRSSYRAGQEKFPRKIETKSWILLATNNFVKKDIVNPLNSNGSTANSRNGISGTNPVELAVSVARNFLEKTSLDRLLNSTAAHLNFSVGPQEELLRIPKTKNIDSYDTALLGEPNAPSPDLISLLMQNEEAILSEAPQTIVWNDSLRQGTNTYFKKILDCVWSVSETNSDFLVDSMETLREELSSESQAHLMIDLLIEKSNKTGGRLPCMLSLCILGGIFEIMLDWCDRQWDIISARNLMVLSQKFFAEGNLTDDPQVMLKKHGILWPRCLTSIGNVRDKSKDVIGKEENEASSADVYPANVNWFVHRIVYHVTIWNRVPFWEDALAYTISEVKQDRLLMELEREFKESFKLELTRHTVRSSAKICEGLLEKFGLCMISFGIIPDQAVNLIRTIGTKYFLSPAEISKIIKPLSDVEFSPKTTHANVPLAPFEALSTKILSSEARSTEVEEATDILHHESSN